MNDRGAARLARIGRMLTVASEWVREAPTIARQERADLAFKRALLKKDAPAVVKALDRGACALRSDLILSDFFAEGRHEPSRPVSLAFGAVERWDHDGMPIDVMNALVNALVRDAPLFPEAAFAMVGDSSHLHAGRALCVRALREGFEANAPAKHVLEVVRRMAQDAQTGRTLSRIYQRTEDPDRVSHATLMDALLAQPPFLDGLRAAPSVDILEATAFALACDCPFADALGFDALSLADARVLIVFARESFANAATNGLRQVSVQAALPRTWARVERADLQAVVHAANAQRAESADATTSSTPTVPGEAMQAVSPPTPRAPRRRRRL